MASKPPCFDEMLKEDGSPRAAYAAYHKWFAEQDSTHLKQKARDAEEFFRRTGITFAVYGEDEAEADGDHYHDHDHHDHHNRHDHHDHHND